MRKNQPAGGPSVLKNKYIGKFWVPKRQQKNGESERTPTYLWSIPRGIPNLPMMIFFHKLLVLDVWGMFHGLVGFFSWEPLLSLQVTCETPQSTQRGLLDIGRQKPFRWVFHLFWRLRTCLSLCESTHPSYSSVRMKKRVWNPPVCLLIWSYERTTYEKKYFFPAQTG